MGKKGLIISIILLISVIIALILGIYVYKKNDVSDTNIISTERLAEVNSEKDNIQSINFSNESLPTSSVNMNISPNAIIIEKKYYKGCDHLIRDVVDIPDELINKTEADVKKEYSGWKIEGYSPTEIIVYKEDSGFCEEHYLVKEHNGVIGIYTIDNEGVEELKEDTEISTQYLPEQDLESLKMGVNIVGETNLHSFLEDYE